MLLMNPFPSPGTMDILLSLLIVLLILFLLWNYPMLLCIFWLNFYRLVVLIRRIIWFLVILSFLLNDLFLNIHCQLLFFHLPLKSNRNLFHFCHLVNIQMLILYSRLVLIQFRTFLVLCDFRSNQILYHVLFCKTYCRIYRCHAQCNYLILHKYWFLIVLLAQNLSVLCLYLFSVCMKNSYPLLMNENPYYLSMVLF